MSLFQTDDFKGFGFRIRAEDNEEKTNTFALVDIIYGDTSKFKYCYYTKDKIHYRIEMKENETKFSISGRNDSFETTEHVNIDSGKLRFQGKGLCINDVHVV